MKAEERKHLQQNELAATIEGWWKGNGKVSSTVWIVAAVLVLGGLLVYAYFYFSKRDDSTKSAAWLELERATDLSQLEKVAEANRGTSVGRAAKLQIARATLQEGLDTLGSETRRTAAVASVEKARDLYAGLIKELADDPQGQREAMLSAAKAEESLIAIPKADNPQESRGTLDKALEYYEELAAKHPDSYQGKLAADRAKEIKENKAAIQAFYQDLAKAYAPKSEPPKIEVPKLPELPKIDTTPKTDTAPPATTPATTPKIEVPPRTEAAPPPKTETAPKTEPATPPTTPKTAPAAPPTTPKIEPPPKTP